ncbi:MAG: 5-formyltetrahydrofolate cyclo-ligase [Lachnospiraceae bacterium]
MESEKQIRTLHKQQRMAMSEEEVRDHSKEICLKLEKLPEVQKKERFYFYFPCRKEVNLLPLAEKLLSAGKRAAFPRVEGDTMEFYEVKSLDDFSEGSFHIMEPIKTVPVEWEDAVVFVPGLVFDTKGNRLGYGRGYYDRYFHTHTVSYKIGIAYAHQIEPSLDAKAWDVPMDLVVTE